MKTHSLPQLPALALGKVSHVREHPIRHAFEYRHFQWLVDLDDLPRFSWPMSLITKFDARDHFDQGKLGGGIKGDVVRWLQARGIEVEQEDRILMLAHARMFGYVFDPLSVFWVVGPSGEVKAAILEVHNTYGQRHCYLVTLDEKNRASVGKEFYVSPFNDVSGSYDVNLRLDEKRVIASIVLSRDGQKIITAVTKGDLVPATPKQIRKAFFTHLFLTQRVSYLIRKHGIWLWLLKLPIIPRPLRPKDNVR